MNEGIRSGRLSDWVVLVAAALFMAVGVLILRYPETPILRLAALGLPAWPVYVAAVVEIVAGIALFHGPLRAVAALVLMAVSLAAAVLNFAYREPQSAVEALGLAVLAVLVLAITRRKA